MAKAVVEVRTSTMTSTFPFARDLHAELRVVAIVGEDDLDL